MDLKNLWQLISVGISKIDFLKQSVDLTASSPLISGRIII